MSSSKKVKFQSCSVFHVVGAMATQKGQYLLTIKCNEVGDFFYSIGYFPYIWFVNKNRKVNFVSEE